MNETRRVFLKESLAAGAIGVAVGTGLLTPRSILAAWPQSAFEAKSVDAALSAAVGSDKTEASSHITVKAPDIAENGAVVPVTVSTDMAGASMIALIAEGNAIPLTSTFELGEGTEAFISTRIKMGKTSNVLAVVKADGKLYSAKKEVKVTIGGCGG